ncbi:MAG: yhjX 1 [Gemmataceae bacterium]|nr:yhjX 1 [Gemmataceae bacterium]
MGQSPAGPARAWGVTGAGMAVNLCLGILYAWSVWKGNLIAPKGVEPGTPMTGVNEGWVYLDPAEATWAYAICGFTFALFMVPGGRLQDRYGPRVGATLAGLCLGAGCVLAGLMKSYLGLVLGFGVLGGIGMGLGYAAATPAAVRWFGPHRRGLIVGLVVGGYGGAAIYIAPLARELIREHGLSGSFVALGVLFAVVIVAAGQFLKMPPAGYTPPAAAPSTKARPAVTALDRTAPEMLGTWQFFALVFLFVGSAQAGLLVIANATPILNNTAKAIAFFAANGWLLASYGGLVNASGRVGTGFYSDGVGRTNAFALNGLAATVCLFLLPSVIAAGNVWLLFAAVGMVYWQYGGTLSLMPALTADYYGSKNLGLNYGLVFLGWGVAFFIPQLGGYIEKETGSMDGAFYLSGGLLAAAVVVSRFVRRPA